MTYITLSQNYGYNVYKVSGLAANSVIDATNATWIVDNSANDLPTATNPATSGSGAMNTYPFQVVGVGSGVLIKGGAIWGQVPQESDWLYTYNNSTALRIENAPSAIIDDWRIDKAWDAIRIGTGTTNFLIDDAHLSNVRDDGVENDNALSGTIRDSLFDGVMSGISLGDGDHVDGSMNTVTLDGLLMRSESYLYKGKITHGSPFKADSGAPETTPDIRISNSVIAIENPNHEGQGRLAIAWSNVVESHGNVFLNLSDTPLPSSYPKPPAGFTILQGQQARDYWEASKKAWLDNHDGVNDVAVTPLPPLPGSGTTPPPTTVTPPPTTTPTDPTAINKITGTNSGNTLNGTAGVDYVDGLGGSDTIYGKGGADVLTGGAGRDKFVFDTKYDGTVDKITDFNPVDDFILLDNAIYTKLGSGSLSSPTRLNSSYLESGKGVRADDSNDYVLYDTGTGMLSYDADGSGSGAPVPIVQLSPGLALSYLDIYVI